MNLKHFSIIFLLSAAIGCAAGNKALPATAGTTALPVTGKAYSFDSFRFLDALATIESGNRNHVTGDHGRSIGAYQFTRPAWNQASRLRAQSLATLVGTNFQLYAYRYARDPFIARLHADYYWRWIAEGLAVALNREPTPGEIYAGYNLGPSGFERRRNKVKFCPSITRAGALKIERLMK